MLGPGLANAVLAQHLLLGDAQPDLFSDFGGLLEKHLFLGRTLLLRLQSYQTCGDAGMLAPGLANALLAQHLVLGVLNRHFDRFRWPTRKAFVLRTDATFAAPWLPNLCWCRNAGSRVSKRCVGAAFDARGVWEPFETFRWRTRKAFGLRTDVAFAAPELPNLCWCRNGGSRGSKRCAGAAFGARGVELDLLGDFGGLLEKHLF